MKTKRPNGSWPARDLYTSPLFVRSRAYAERHADRWYVLSALYGLVRPDELIESYDCTLIGRRKADRLAWAERVRDQICTGGVIAAGDEIIWLAGRTYSSQLGRLLTGHTQYDPLRGMNFGRRLAWLSRQARG